MTDRICPTCQPPHQRCPTHDGPPAPGPVETAALELREKFRLPLAQAAAVADAAFTAAHAAGWRIVRTEEVGYPAFSLHMSACYPVAAIIDEWQPACPGDPDPRGDAS